MENAAAERQRPYAEEDGTLRLAPMSLPPSAAWSPQAKAVFMKRFTGLTVSGTGGGRAVEFDADYVAWGQPYRAGMEAMHSRMAANSLKRYPAKIDEAEIAGVRVEIVTPEAGVAQEQKGRVLINLHGGAFVGGAKYCGLVESIPLSSSGGMKIVCVDYRQGWENVFPAASEDVAAVYSALLNDHAPEQIGIFGYSAGGALTGQAVAWFIDKGLTVPGAIAICSAGLGGEAMGAAGDSGYLGAAAMGDRPPSPPPSAAPAQPQRFGYFAGQDPQNPMISPLSVPEILARFPATLVLTGTRAFDLSSSLVAHRALLAAGCAAELHCWEGMWHCFPYNSDMPEAHDAYRTLLKFFDGHLAR